MARRPNKHPATALLGRDAFLRSINLVYDADSPDRISHFFPTEKSAALISKLAGHEPERAFLVVAPYGSGKSLAGAYAIHATENRPEARETLKNLNMRMEEVFEPLAKDLTSRVKTWSKRGLSIALVGHSENVVRSLLKAACASLARLNLTKEAAALTEVADSARPLAMPEALELLKKTVTAASLDQVVILWDEFGRHLETLVTEGKASELLDLQTLAEFVARQKKTPFTLSLFLHQGLLDYASNLPQIVRREWKKIEGRFVTIDYVEDSKEIYRLIGDILLNEYGDDAVPMSEFTAKAKQLLTAGRFHGFKQGELATLLKKTCPLAPATLELLPRIAARVAQNERTLFSFLFSLHDFVEDGEIGADVLYDYFSEQMQADVEVGGTHRQWLETESAISKVAGDYRAESALKTICLLGLGLSGERTKTNRQQTILACAGYAPLPSAEEVIDDLISRKLLLHRKHSDEVAIWHGTDLDLRGRLEDSKSAQEAGFNLIAFLEHEACPPLWKPQEYNDDFSIRRFFPGEFITVSEIEERAQLISKDPDHLYHLPFSIDGKIFYVIPDSPADAQRAEEIVSGIADHDLFPVEAPPQIIFALPSETLPVREAALEVHCLLQMEQDADLTSQDPLVVPEIQQMLDDSRAQLQRLLDRLTSPQSGGSRWVHKGQAYQIEAPRLLRRFLSNIMREVFPLTPRIRSEVIVRNRASAPVVNSRKKLMMGILERSGQQMFGIEGNFPDASMARTVLIQTGIYRQAEQSDRWVYAVPKALDDPGLGKVWNVVRDFFTEPSEQGKSPQELLDVLAAPPYGIRAALIPIFFGAGLKAFAFTTSLLRDGEYVADVLPSTIEECFKEPSRHLLKIIALDADQREFLQHIRKIFGAHANYGDEQDLIRQAHESIQFWFGQTDEAAKTTKMLSKEAKAFRNAVKRQRDPVVLFFEDLPRITGKSLKQLGSTSGVKAITRLKAEVDQVVPHYIEIAIRTIRTALDLEKANGSLREGVQTWAESFLVAVPKGHKGMPTLKRATMDYESDEQLAESVVAGVLAASIRHWTDDDIRNFERAFAELVVSIETSALQSDLSNLKGTRAGEAMSGLLKQRIRDYATKLSKLEGTRDATNILEELLAHRAKSLQSR